MWKKTGQDKNHDKPTSSFILSRLRFGAGLFVCAKVELDEEEKERSDDKVGEMQAWQGSSAGVWWASNG